MGVNINRIWEEFSVPLKRYIMKHVQDQHDAEDILQEIFCKITHSMSHLKNENKLQSWVYQITRNAIIDYYRSRKVVVVLPQMFESMIDESATEGGAADEITLCIRKMIDHLPDKYRQAIILTEFEGLTQKELADELGMSLSGAKSRVQRARKRLKDMLLECCHFEFDGLGHIIEYQHREKICCYCARDLHKE